MWVKHLVNRIVPPLAISILSLFLAFEIAGFPQQAPLVPLAIDNKVLPASNKNYLTDPRVFNAEFYRKLYPQLKLADDNTAKLEWMSKGARACRRGAFLFYSTDYLNRYSDLAKDCDAAVEHFVVAGFNEGRIGAADSYGVVFDVNYYVDPANNPDLTKAYPRVWDLVDVQLHWLQHGIGERRGASPFFNVREYQARYADVPSDPARAISEYVASGQAKGRLGRAAWADPASWNALVQQTVRPEVNATPNDVVRSFTSARGKQVKVVVKSPSWYEAAFSPPWQKLDPSQVCMVPPPTGERRSKEHSKLSGSHGHGPRGALPRGEAGTARGISHRAAREFARTRGLGAQPPAALYDSQCAGFCGRWEWIDAVFHGLDGRFQHRELRAGNYREPGDRLGKPAGSQPGLAGAAF